MPRLQRALIEFGFGKESVPLKSLATTGNVIAIGVPPIRIDLLNRIDGVSFEKATASTVRGSYGTIDVNFIGLEDLILNKSSTTRSKDKADVEGLS